MSSLEDRIEAALTDAPSGDNPGEGGGTPADGPEADSGPQDAPGTPPDGDAEPDATGEIQVTAPTLPAELHLSRPMYWLQRLPDGKMALKIVASVETPVGPQPMPPAYVLRFTAEAWAEWQENMAAGEVKDRSRGGPDIVTARTLPPDLRRPGS